jgi:hypothetical protein
MIGAAGSLPLPKMPLLMIEVIANIASTPAAFIG